MESPLMETTISELSLLLATRRFAPREKRLPEIHAGEMPHELMQCDERNAEERGEGRRDGKLGKKNWVRGRTQI